MADALVKQGMARETILCASCYLSLYLRYNAFMPTLSCSLAIVVLQFFFTLILNVVACYCFKSVYIYMYIFFLLNNGYLFFFFFGDEGIFMVLT